MQKYPLIRSTLEGIFGAQAGLSDEDSAAALQRDLEHGPFKEGIREELSQAMADAALSWQELLGQCDVDLFDTEEDARKFIDHKIVRFVFR